MIMSGGSTTAPTMPWSLPWSASSNNKHNFTCGHGLSGAPPSNEMLFKAFWREKSNNILGLRHPFLCSFSSFLIPRVVLGEN